MGIQSFFTTCVTDIHNYPNKMHAQDSHFSNISQLLMQKGG